MGLAQIAIKSRRHFV